MYRRKIRGYVRIGRLQLIFEYRNLIQLNGNLYNTFFYRSFRIFVQYK